MTKKPILSIIISFISFLFFSLFLARDYTEFKIFFYSTIELKIHYFSHFLFAHTIFNKFAVIPSKQEKSK